MILPSQVQLPKNSSGDILPIAEEDLNSDYIHPNDVRKTDSHDVIDAPVDLAVSQIGLPDTGDQGVVTPADPSMPLVVEERELITTPADGKVSEIRRNSRARSVDLITLQKTATLYITEDKV